MTIPTTTTATATGRFNCRSPFQRFIVERCAGAVTVSVAVDVAVAVAVTFALSQLSAANRSH